MRKTLDLKEMEISVPLKQPEALNSHFSFDLMFSFKMQTGEGWMLYKTCANINCKERSFDNMFNEIAQRELNKNL